MGVRAAFGFIGVANPAFVDAQPMQFARENERADALARAKEELAALAEYWGNIEPRAMLSRAS